MPPIGGAAGRRMLIVPPVVVTPTDSVAERPPVSAIVKVHEPAPCAVTVNVEPEPEIVATLGHAFAFVTLNEPEELVSLAVVVPV